MKDFHHGGMPQPDRRQTWSEKWDRWADRPDVLPLWVADMDEPAPPVVLAALRSRIEHGVLGYTHIPREFSLAVAGWMERRHQWSIDPEWVVAGCGSMVLAEAAARVLGEPGSGGVVTPPLYPPFLRTPDLAGRRGIRVPLVETSAGFRLDVEALERALQADAGTPQAARVLWWCAPHNPSGRVWSSDELNVIADMVRRHDLSVVSDDVWMDLVLEPGVRHVPLVRHAPDLAARSITLVAPSKTFNLPGLATAAAIIPDPRLRRRVQAGLRWPNLMGLVGAVAAWNEGDAWLDALCVRLRQRRDRAAAALRAAGWRLHVPEATYLLWADVRHFGWTDPAATCLAAGVGLSDGRDFAAPGWLRLNFACDDAVLDEAVTRLVAISAA